MSAISSIRIPSGAAYDFKDSAALRAASAAPGFSSSTSYSAGDICTYEGKVYRATQAHSGAWNAAHFSECAPLQTQLDAVFAGIYVQNATTGLWHKLVAQDNGSGYVTLGVEQTGVASWPT